MTQGGDRAERLAHALRANLRRRKAQARDVRSASDAACEGNAEAGRSPDAGGEAE